MEHELPGVLDEVDEPVTVAELEDVVRRARQRRRATLVGGAAMLLLVGAVAGAVARGPDDRRTTGFAAPPSTVPPAMAAPMGGPFGGPLAPLFRREANGVTIRAYMAQGDTSDKPCGPPGILNAELSNAAAISFAVFPDWTGKAKPMAPRSLFLLNMNSFGGPEGEPVTWALFRAGDGVASVRLRVGPVSDSMAVEKGFALLVVTGNADGAAAEALDAAGGVVATVPLLSFLVQTQDPGTICPPTACTAPAPTTVPGSAVKPDQTTVPIQACGGGCATAEPSGGAGRGTEPATTAPPAAPTAAAPTAAAPVAVCDPPVCSSSAPTTPVAPAVKPDQAHPNETITSCGAAVPAPAPVPPVSAPAAQVAPAATRPDPSAAVPPSPGTTAMGIPPSGAAATTTSSPTPPSAPAATTAP